MANISAIALVGQNADSILSWLTEIFAQRAKLFGISVTVVDISQEAQLTQLSTLLQATRPSFCFSFQGFGMGLRVDAGNLWTSLNIPFISLMGDAPYYAPFLHANEGPTLFHLYTSEDFRQVYGEIMGGKNFSSVFGGFYPPNPLADEIPWHDRDLEIVYVKSGVDSGALRAKWTEFPNKLRGVIENASSVALARQQETIGQIVMDSFAASSMHFGQNRTLLLRTSAAVDSYVRAVRAERMLREVMRHGGHIFGDWPHIDKVNTRARFHGRIPAEKLDQIYGRSRILMNVLPCTMYSLHERIVGALVSQAFSISDGTAFMVQRLKDYPNFKSVKIDSPVLADELDLHISEIRKLGSGHKNELQSMLRESRLRAEAEFSVDHLISEIIELASMSRLERNSSSWAFLR